MAASTVPGILFVTYQLLIYLDYRSGFIHGECYIQFFLWNKRIQNQMVPVLHEVLPVKHESRNCHNRYAITVVKRLPGTLVVTVVGHLPREISRFTYFIIVHRAKVSCKVMDVHNRRSPVGQGGLEIPCKVIVEMEMMRKCSCY